MVTFRSGCHGALLLGLLVASSALADSHAPPVPLAVSSGGVNGAATCEVVLPTTAAGSKFVLIVSSLAAGPQKHRVRVTTEASTGPVVIPQEQTSPDMAWRQRTASVQQRLALARERRPSPQDYPPRADPPRLQTFHLFAGEHDFHDPSRYVTVTGELRAVGRHCLVYVDRDHPDPRFLQPAVDDVVRTFDDDAHPRACRELGRVLDVDRDGRFTILFTGWLGKMSNGKVSLGGFVRGSDFYRDLAAPFGNRCDMMFLNTDLKPGPHLRTLLAHEYTHAIVFSEHTFGRHLPEVPPQDEESWLNEGLAHLMEERHGHGWSNLDYRVSAFLHGPERYPLVVADYYGAGLWRSPGCRGATYLFMHACRERYGDELARRLVQSSLAGTANLEAATGELFAELFRRWTVWMFSTPELRGRLGGRLLAGPCCHEIPLDQGKIDMEVAGTSAAYLLLHSPTAACSRVIVQSEPGTELQVTLLPLPSETPRLTLQVQPTHDPRSVRLVLAAHDGDVALDEAAWERLAPSSAAEDETSWKATPSGTSAGCWFGEPVLKAGESRTSTEIALPRGPGATVFKVLATDARGRRQSAWAAVR